MSARHLVLPLIVGGCLGSVDRHYVESGTGSDGSPSESLPAAIGGTVTGVEGQGLVLQNAGKDDLPVMGGAFSFRTKLTPGEHYDVTVLTPPVLPSQTCTVTNGVGDAHGTDVTDVAVTCATNRYLVGGTVSGLKGTLVLQNNDGDDKTITADGPFTFATSVASGSPYSVLPLTQPANQVCAVAKGSGTVGGADVSSVDVHCATPIAFSENFDGVTAPALPPGWKATIAQGRYAWKTDTAAASSAPNSAFVGESLVVADVSLDSPIFTVESPNAKLSFTHTWSMPSHYAGGVVEISVNDGPFDDIIAAGGQFESGPYTSALASNQGPIGARKAWTGNGGPTTTIIRLSPDLAGKNVQLRWRYAALIWNENKTWRFDDVVVRN